MMDELNLDAGVVHNNLNKKNAFVTVTIEMPDSLFGFVGIPYT